MLTLRLSQSHIHEDMMLLTSYSRSRCANISSGLNDHVQLPTLWLLFFVFVVVVVGGGGGLGCFSVGCCCWG